MPTSKSPGTPSRGAASPRTINARSQGEAAGAQLVDTLNSLVEDLIKENRRLQKQVDKLSAGGTGPAAASLERGLKAIQKRIEKTLALSGAGAPAARRKSPVRPATGSARVRRKPATPPG